MRRAPARRRGAQRVARSGRRPAAAPRTPIRRGTRAPAAAARCTADARSTARNGKRPTTCRMQGRALCSCGEQGCRQVRSVAHSLGKVAPAGHRAPVHAARRASWACFGAPERAVGRSYPHPNPTLDVALGSRPSAHTSGAGAVACLRLRGAWARLGHMRRGGRADAALPARRRRVARLHLGGGVDRQVCACAGHAQTHSVSGEARTRCA